MSCSSKTFSLLRCSVVLERRARIARSAWPAAVPPVASARLLGLVGSCVIGLLT